MVDVRLVASRSATGEPHAIPATPTSPFQTQPRGAIQSVDFSRVQPIDSAFKQLPQMEQQVLTLQRPTLQLFPAVRELINHNIMELVDSISMDDPDIHKSYSSYIDLH